MKDTLLSLAQGWAHYGPRALFGPLSSLIGTRHQEPSAGSACQLHHGMESLSVLSLWGWLLLDDLASVGLLLAPVVQVQSKRNHGSVVGLLVRAGLGRSGDGGAAAT